MMPSEYALCLTLQDQRLRFVSSRWFYIEGSVPTLEDVVKRFFATPEGFTHLEATKDVFVWEDVVRVIPDAFWREHGYDPKTNDEMDRLFERGNPEKDGIPSYHVVRTSTGSLPGTVEITDVPFALHRIFYVKARSTEDAMRQIDEHAELQGLDAFKRVIETDDVEYDEGVGEYEVPVTLYRKMRFRGRRQDERSCVLRRLRLEKFDVTRYTYSVWDEHAWEDD